MPIKIQSDLPAKKILEYENIFVMTEDRAASQDIRPLKIAIVNLMPTKEVTETQLLRLLGNTPIQLDISLVRMEHHESTHVNTAHLEKFYITSAELLKNKYDGLIITGAPVEQLPFEEVDYWKDLCKIMDWAQQNVYSTLYICWGAQAGLYHKYRIQKHILTQKMFGLYKTHKTVRGEPLTRGFDDVFSVPTSRHTTIKREDILNEEDLTILAENTSGDVTICKSKNNRSIFMTGHLEYDTDTLANEYFRDKNKGLEIQLPRNYFPDDDAEKKPLNTWRSTAHLFFSNWINYYVYQETPYQL